MATIEPTPEPGVYKVMGRYTTHWRAVVDVDAGPDGKRRQKTRTFDTFREAVDWRLATRHALRERTYLEPSDEPLSDFLARWLDSLTRPGPASLLRYRQTVRRQIAPHLGAVALGDLTPARIDGWTAALSREGLSGRTVHQAFTLLNQALRAAVRWRLLAVNPCAAALPPHAERYPARVWDGAQLRRFLAHVADDDYAPLWQLEATLGVRRGELLVLRWQDVDLEAASLSIARGLTRDAAGRWVAGAPKSASSRREIPLPSALVGSLRLYGYRQAERRDTAGAGWVDEGLVFDRGDGRMLHNVSHWQRFRALTDEAGLPRIRPHDLRHSAASYMLVELGLPLVLVSRILGHANIGITADTYAHVDRAALREAARQLDGLFPSPG